MEFCIEDTRKKATPAVQGLIDNKTINTDSDTQLCQVLVQP